MKIFFWSSTEYSGFLERLINELNAVDLKAQQRFQIPDTTYRSAKSTLARCLLRIRQYLIYPIQLCSNLWVRRLRQRLVGLVHGKSPARIGTAVNKTETESEVFVICTNTFFCPLLATFLHKNVIHLVYDLFPEAMIHSGKWKEGSVQVKVIRWITGLTLKRAKQNVFLGERLKGYVESIHGRIPNAVIIPVGADQTPFNRKPSEKAHRMERLIQHANFEDKSASGQLFCVEKQKIQHLEVDYRDEPTILYCGNFGNMHDSITLFQYWDKVHEGIDNELGSSPATESSIGYPNVFWRFHCSGPKRVELELVCEGLADNLKSRIKLGDGLRQSEWIQMMEESEVALVTMMPGAETVVMPSKTYSAMMAGQAILAIAPEESDLVDLIKAADCGWFVEPGDVNGLSQVLKEIISKPNLLLQKRENAFHYAHCHYGQDILAKQWKTILETVAS